MWKDMSKKVSFCTDWIANVNQWKVSYKLFLFLIILQGKSSTANIFATRLSIRNCRKEGSQTKR
jgi:hypothetical protein